MDHLFKGILIPLNNFSLSFNERIRIDLTILIIQADRARFEDGS